MDDKGWDSALKPAAAALREWRLQAALNRALQAQDARQALQQGCTKLSTSRDRGALPSNSASKPTIQGRSRFLNGFHQTSNPAENDLSNPQCSDTVRSNHSSGLKSINEKYCIFGFGFLRLFKYGVPACVRLFPKEMSMYVPSSLRTKITADKRVTEDCS